MPYLYPTLPYPYPVLLYLTYTFYDFRLFILRTIDRQPSDVTGDLYSIIGWCSMSASDCVGYAYKESCDIQVSGERHCLDPVWCVNRFGVVA